MRTTGTISRGLRAPIIRQGDDLVGIVADAVLNAAEQEGFSLRDRDVVGVTEAVLARAQGNYATVGQIAADVAAKYPSGELGLTLPILSRNRFSMLLRGIAQGVSKLTIQLAYPSDEVGNPLIGIDLLDEKGIDPHTDVLTETEFTRLFGKISHPFTGVNYIDYYKDVTGGKAEFLLANDPRAVLAYTKHVLTADIHTRHRSKRLLRQAGAETVYGLDDLLTAPVDGSGFHPTFGLLGSNLATDDKVKLFPRDAQEFVDKLAGRLYEKTGKRIEAMVYGDGAFKDPIGGIWELADPVVSPGYTAGLNGLPSELKLKYLADNTVGDLDGSRAGDAIRQMIRDKKPGPVADISSQGTTPRRLTDLLGSLCDLTSGSGDKGTPIILIQGYFDTYAD